MRLAGMNIELYQTAIERGSADSQPFSRFGPIAFGIGESGKQFGFLILTRQRNPRGGARGNRHGRYFRREIRGKNVSAFAADHREFDGAFQFAHISRPCVAHEEPEGVWT